MSLALIGITCGMKTQAGKSVVAIPEAYMQAVFKAGGLPVIIPETVSPAEFDGLRQRLDGLLLTGGADVNPLRFNGKPNPKVYGIDEQRDEVEINLARLAASTGWPFLGICRGIQVINVALGGTLFTDIMDQMPGALKHDYDSITERDFEAHPVQLEPDSLLARTLFNVGASSVRVNSLHHQGIEKVAAGLRPTAAAPDRLVEAVELPGHPFGLGVQWHPEAMPDSPQMQALFRAFVEATQKV
jgi:putative glutamine amidotransferase